MALELTAEAAQKTQLALECRRGVRASGDCDHERRGHPGAIHRERLLEDVLVVGAVRGDRRPSLRIWAPRAVVQNKRGKVVFAWAAARGLQVVPDSPGSGLDAVEEVGIAVQ